MSTATATAGGVRQLTAPITEVADIVATLMQHHVIARSDETLASTVRLLGLTNVDVSNAARRLARRGWPTLRPTGRTQLTLDSAAGDESGYDPRDHRRTRELDGRLQLHCTGGLTDPAHWADEHDFPLRADRANGSRRAKCAAHYLETQRARRITSHAVEAFDRGGLELRTDTDGRVIGVECAVCGRPLECGCDHPQAAAA